MLSAGGPLMPVGMFFYYIYKYIKRHMDISLNKIL